jgi:Lon protease-like protein
MAHGPESNTPGEPLSEHFEAVPLFPLPNVVLLPHAVLPLHIFEERYEAMTAAALKGNGQIAMALLKPGWERDYYARPAIEPVVCIGQILSHEQLPDGKYNFLLRGMARARIVHEHASSPYRTADLQVIAETSASELDLSDLRRRLTHFFKEQLSRLPPVVGQFLTLLDGPLRTEAIADLIAFHLLDDVPFKQSILQDGDVQSRVKRIVDAVEQAYPPTGMQKLRYPDDPRTN